MTHLDQIPPAAAIAIAVLLLIGATLALIGSFGLVRLRSFYERLHAPTLGASWGTGAVALASMLTFSALEGAPVVHELVIGAFIMITTPIALLLLGRAAHRRDFPGERDIAGVPAPGAEPSGAEGSGAAGAAVSAPAPDRAAQSAAPAAGSAPAR